jgi:hypothetical protein
VTAAGCVLTLCPAPTGRLSFPGRQRDTAWCVGACDILESCTPPRPTRRITAPCLHLLSQHDLHACSLGRLMRSTGSMCVRQQLLHSARTTSGIEQTSGPPAKLVQGNQLPTCGLWPSRGTAEVSVLVDATIRFMTMLPCEMHCKCTLIMYHAVH